jgi:hypothetical protein
MAKEDSVDSSRLSGGEKRETAKETELPEDKGKEDNGEGINRKEGKKWAKKANLQREVRAIFTM